VSVSATEPLLEAQPLSPYKGLAPFEDSELDELLFFGREHDRAVIAANLVASHLTVLYGPSGVGKSSILRAGVARELRALPERPLVVLHETWAEDPVGSLSESIAAAAGVEPGALADTIELAAALHGHVYLLLDQVEAYFVHHAGELALADAIVDLQARPELPVHLLLSIREDALARLDAFKGQLPGLLSNRLRLDHLTRAAGRRAIEGPVEGLDKLVPAEKGIRLEPELVEAVLDGVRAGAVVQAGRGQGVAKSASPQGRIEAPYLQLVMQRLWEVERGEGSRVLRLETLEALGGPSRIVEAHLARALAALSPEQQELAARIFNQLVTPSGMKISHSTADLARYAGTSADELEPVLETLGRQRILRSVGGEDGEDAYEIFHDVLADAVLAWQGRFATERQLAQERAAGRARHRRLIAVVGVSLLALAVMAAVTVYALSQRSDARSSARDARSRAYAFNALALLPSDPEQSLALGLQASALEPSSQLAEPTLRDALLAVRGLHSFPGGGGRVRDAEFNPDGTLVATAGGTEGRLFRAASGDLVGVLRTAAPVESVSFSPDGRTLVTAGGDGRALLWDAATGAQLRALGGSGSLTAALFSPDGRVVVTTGTDRTARVWSASSGRLIHSFRHPAIVRGAAFSPNGRRIVTFGNDHLARVFDVASGKLGQTLNAKSLITDARFSPDGELIATTGRDGIARLWNARRGTLVHAMSTRVDPAATDNLLGSAFSPDGKWLVTVGTDGTGRVWNVATGQLETLLVGHLSAIDSVAFSPDGSRIVTAGSDGSGRIWSFPDGSQQAVLLGHRAAVARAMFDHDGSKVLTASSDGTARTWNGEIYPVLTELGKHRGAATGVAFSPDGSTLASAGVDGYVRLWPRTGRGRRRAIRAGVPLEDVTFSRDGKLLAAAGRDGRALVWSFPASKLVHEVKEPGVVEAVAFSPDGKLLATAGSDGTARLTPLDGGPPVVLRHPAAVEDIAFSPDGEFVATAGADDLTRLWRVRDGAPVRAFRGHTDDVTGVSFSPDGRRLVTSSRDHDVRIWDVATGRMVRLLHGHSAFVSDAGFSPDGRWVVSAGPGKAGIWAVSANDLPLDRLYFLSGHHRHLAAAVFAPSGWTVATAGADGTIRTYACALCGGSAQLRALAEQRLAALRHTAAGH
jgi:WD40 repeat protein